MTPTDRDVTEAELARLDAALVAESDPARRMELRVETVRRLTRALLVGRADRPLRQVSIIRGVVLGSTEAEADAEAAARVARESGARYTPTPADLEAAEAARGGS